MQIYIIYTHYANLLLIVNIICKTTDIYRFAYIYIIYQPPNPLRLAHKFACTNKGALLASLVNS